MEGQLYELIKRARSHDEEAMLNLIGQFNPIVKKYSRMLNYDGAYTDLLIHFIKAVKNIRI